MPTIPDSHRDLADAGRIGAKYGGADVRDNDGPGETRVVVTIDPVRVDAVDMTAG